MPRASCLISFDHLIRSIKRRLRNRQADLVGRFEVDHQFELRWLLDGQIGWLGSLQDSVVPILDFGLPILDCRNKYGKLSSKNLHSCVLPLNRKSKI